MIDVITTGELRRLAETETANCVSIYLPTHRAGREKEQDQIRLRNAVASATRELVALGMRPPEADELLASVSVVEEGEFWAHLEQGLAVFTNASGTQAYRLIEPVDELVVVADRFHIKPLLPLVATGELFYVLALSQNEVRLLRGSRYRVSEMALGDIPPSLAAALWYEDREAQLHSHGAKRTGTGQVAATFHGQGVGIDTTDADLARFLSAVDDGVRHIIGSGQAPLVLAGVESTVAHYRQVSSYPNIVPDAVAGSPEALSAAELHERAWPLAEPVFGDASREARTAIESGAVPVADSLTDVVVAAHGGRVATAFVPLGVQRWGVFDAESQQVDEHAQRDPGDRDLLDAIAVETLAHGGHVYVVDADDVPRDAPVVAALRY